MREPPKKKSSGFEGIRENLRNSGIRKNSKDYKKNAKEYERGRESPTKFGKPSRKSEKILQNMKEV